MLPNCECYAKATDSERQELWKRIFPPDGKVPITCPLPLGHANLAGQRSPFFLIDFDRVTPDQRARLIDEMSKKFNLPRDEVESDIQKQGAPVKATDVLVSWCRIHSLAVM
jgi:hypothetical protein